MLEFTPEVGETLVIGGNIKVIVKSIKGQQVHLAIVAPRDVAVNREEVHKRIQAEKNGNK